MYIYFMIFPQPITSPTTILNLSINSLYPPDIAHVLNSDNSIPLSLHPLHSSCSFPSSYPAQQPRSSHSLPQNSPPDFSIPGYRPPILDFQLLYILLNSIPPSRARSSNSPSSFWLTFQTYN